MRVANGPGALVSSRGSSGCSEARGVEAERLGAEPGGDRERQILWRCRLGSPSRKAQRVGGKSESSTSRRSYAGEALAVKSREIPDSDGVAKTLAESEKPTECGDAAVRRERTVGRTSGE